MTSATAVTEVDIISDVIAPDRGDLPPPLKFSVIEPRSGGANSR